MYSFKGKIALITGSSTGIGKDIALRLSEKGCTVILHYFHSEKEATKTQKQIIQKSRNKNVDLMCADVTCEKSVELLFAEIKKKYKKLDILVNNVGNYIKKPLEKLKPFEWHAMIDGNLNCTYYCTHYGLPLLRKSKSGRVINIGYSSTGNLSAKPSILPYQIAKTGILLMTKSYAQIEAKNNVLFNMISPGVMENSVSLPEKEIPLKYPGKLIDLSRTVLQTIENDYMTGAHIEHAGGFNL